MCNALARLAELRAPLIHTGRQVSFQNKFLFKVNFEMIIIFSFFSFLSKKNNNKKKWSVDVAVMKKIVHKKSMIERVNVIFIFVVFLWMFIQVEYFNANLVDDFPRISSSVASPSTEMVEESGDYLHFCYCFLKI